MGNTALVIMTEPTEEPITLDEAKAHLYLDTEDDDALVLTLIKAAREYAETMTRQAMITQTWKYYLEEWPENKSYIELPLPPLQSVSSITYEDYNGTVTTWSNTLYEVDTFSKPGRVVLAYGESWPTATLNVSNPICITFVCGYGTPDDIPENLKAAMKIDLADLYEERESYTDKPVNHIPILERLYTPYRIWGF